MSMHTLRGLEMVCITRQGDFMLNYTGAGVYENPRGEPIKDLLDMGCLGCGAAYFTTESGAIDFCPACGYMDRKHFTSFQELQAWSNAQHWGFLKRNDHRAFGGERDEEWHLVFAPEKASVAASGHFSDVRDLLG